MPISPTSRGPRSSFDLDALTPSRDGCRRSSDARFDTSFFVAAALPGLGPRVRNPAMPIGNGPAASLLDRIDASSDHAIFPTKRNLERIARFARSTRPAPMPHVARSTRSPVGRGARGEPHVCSLRTAAIRDQRTARNRVRA